MRPAISGTRFLPLAVPNNVITKVQVRYYDECRDPSHSGTPLAKRDLAPLPAANQGGFAALGGGTLWGLPSASDPTVGDPARAFDLSLPSYGGCGQAYLPIGTEVRIASRNEVDLDALSCTQLLALRYADCFSRLSQIRLWNDGDPDNQVRIGDVRLTGGCGNTDGYFGTLPVGRDELPLRRLGLGQLGRPRQRKQGCSGQLQRHGQRRRRHPLRIAERLERVWRVARAFERSHRERRRQYRHGRRQLGGHQHHAPVPRQHQLPER